MKDLFLKLLSWSGYKKVMFGTDWPLIPIKPYIELMKSMKLPESMMEQIMYKNALRFFWK